MQYRDPTCCTDSSLRSQTRQSIPQPSQILPQENDIQYLPSICAMFMELQKHPTSQLALRFILNSERCFNRTTRTIFGARHLHGPACATHRQHEMLSTEQCCCWAICTPQISPWRRQSTTFHYQRKDDPPLSREERETKCSRWEPGLWWPRI